MPDDESVPDDGHEDANRVGRRELLGGVGKTAALAGLAGVVGWGAAGGVAVGGTRGHRGTRSQDRARVVRGTILYFTADPKNADDDPGTHLFEDGALVLDDKGKVDKVVAWSELSKDEQDDAIDHRDDVIVPGFIDPHIHSAQIDAIASPGGQLLPWLKSYIYPAELKFSDKDFARKAASDFLDILLAAGTTTASVYTTTYKTSTDMFFEESQKRNMRMVAGKVMMDTGGKSQGGPVPDEYLDSSLAQAEADIRELIDKWHEKDGKGNPGRQLYCVTPRFAPTSTEDALRMMAKLYREYESQGHPVWMQTHLAENLDEGDLVLDLFSNLQPRSYLDVYDKLDLVGERAVFAHCVWLDRQDIGTTDTNYTDHHVMATKGAGIAFCPTSNLFLGSGLFQLDLARQLDVRVGLGTDVGAGTSYSLLQTMNEAYKVVGLGNTLPVRERDEGRRNVLSALRAFYLATRGSAEALHLEDRIGSFENGREGDFVILDLAATPTLERRTAAAKDNPANESRKAVLLEQLFALMTLGDARATKATYVMGEKKYDREDSKFMPCPVAS